ncbi:hypothetical protein SeW_A0725 [Salmonella enterica subsp. enterica serovar Weltevreden str. HI_N05-537]|nr:hypothetical protein SeW_A0725 [Salmonella enterica subsp. enterica serovar Weltevreden str. HI_N05-537]
MLFAHIFRDLNATFLSERLTDDINDVLQHRIAQTQFIVMQRELDLFTIHRRVGKAFSASNG